MMYLLRQLCVTTLHKFEEAWYAEVHDQSYCSKKPVGSSSVTITEFLSTQKSISRLHLGVDPQSL